MLPSIKEGDFFKMGDKEYEVDYNIPLEDFNSGKHFSGKTAVVPEAIPVGQSSGLQKPFSRITPRAASATAPKTTRKGISLHPVNLIKLPGQAIDIDEPPREKQLSQQLYWSINWYLIFI